MAWLIAFALTAARAITVFVVPLSGDEAYYWEWSRRLAFGYGDHPPLVAWTIAAFSWIGSNPGFVRIGFVLCGAVATLAIAACAAEIAENPRAGAAAALAFSLTPILTIAFGMATPDGPYLAFWALALWLGARAFRRDERWAWIALGFAVGGLALSRFLGWAFIFGLIMYALWPQRRWAWRRGLWLSLAIAAIVYVPFVVWNAEHNWETFVFTFVARHVRREFSVQRVLEMYETQAAAFSPALFIGALLLAIRPKSALVGWTAVPLILLLTLLCFFERVEVYWVFGAYASLCVGIGIAYVAMSKTPRRIWAVASALPALALLPTLFAAVLAPAATFRLLQHFDPSYKRAGPWEIYTSQPLARDVKALAASRDAVVMTDGYGFSSVLDYYGDIPPLVIGYDWQGAQARTWITHIDGPRTALFVDKIPLSHVDAQNLGRPEFVRQLQLACTRVEPGPHLRYDAGMGFPKRSYYLTWCDGLTDRGLAILRWQNTRGL